MYFLLPSSKPKLRNIFMYKISTTSLWDYPTTWQKSLLGNIPWHLDLQSPFLSLSFLLLLSSHSLPFLFSVHSLQILAAGSNILSLSLFLPTHLCASTDKDTSPALLPFRAGITQQLLNVGLSAAEKKKRIVKDWSVAKSNRYAP